LKYFKKSEDADEVVQEVFLKVFLHLKSFQKKANIKTWIYRIALNEIFGRFRKEKKYAMKMEIKEDVSDEIDRDEIRFYTEVKEEFLKQVRKLPKKRSETIVLKLTEGLSFREIGEVIGISEDSAKNLYHIGIKEMRKKMEGYIHGKSGKMGAYAS